MNANHAVPAQKAKRKIGSPRRRPAGRRKRTRSLVLRSSRALLMVALAGIVYFAGMSAWIHYHWKHAHATPADCIIVLGAAVWNNEPSPALRERLDVALELTRKGMASRVIVTGGSSPGEWTEAAMSKKYMVDHGVPADRIVLEDQSRSTIENLLNAKTIMAKNGYRNAIIVTHGFHALRAQMMADHVSIPATVEPVQITPLNLVYYTLRECAGIALFQAQRWFL